MKIATKPRSNKTLEKTVSFEFYAPQAKKVELAGSFNNWKSSKTALKKNKEGKWRLEIKLPVGRYEYRYQVDGSWQNDQRPTVECAPNAFGSWNCVLEVQ
ncbi:MAG: isoamylase early set domain-containing protein [Candidatus Omnitrophica bacterium]|nr:isoamylase early set domain-containing protein [Candidatus Omnitrophota bacterium]